MDYFWKCIRSPRRFAISYTLATESAGDSLRPECAGLADEKAVLATDHSEIARGRADQRFAAFRQLLVEESEYLLGELPEVVVLPVIGRVAVHGAP